MTGPTPPDADDPEVPDLSSDSSSSSADFQVHRGHCFAVAYRMLGSVADADDIVQEAWLRWAGAHADLRRPRAWLTRVVTRLAIDRLRAQARTRAVYVGPWLPEPLLDGTVDLVDEVGLAAAPKADPADHVELGESVKMAFLVVLEQLGPIERAVFLLRSVFDRDYDEIAAATGKSATNCRQIYARARGRIDAARPRFDVPVAEHLALLFQFQQATEANDTQALVAALAPDAVLTSDGGGKRQAALKPIHGAAKIAKFALGVWQLQTGETELQTRMINGQPGALLFVDGELDSVISSDIVDGKIVRIHIVRNPDKLRHLQLG